MAANSAGVTEFNAVRGLGRQDRRDEQLNGTEVELATGVRVRIRQRTIDPPRASYGRQPALFSHGDSLDTGADTPARAQTSTTISTSTGASNGSTVTPTALRAWAEPKTSVSSVLAPLATCG